MGENALSPKTVTVLRLIADGQSYAQIVERHPNITYLDIFSAAGEALELGEMMSEESAVSSTADGASPRVSAPASDPPLGQTVAGAMATPLLPGYSKTDEPWSAREDTQLIRLSRAGVSLDGLARTFEREPQTIQGRLDELRDRMTNLGLS